MSTEMTDNDWSKLKGLLGSYVNQREALEEIQQKQDEARSFEIQFEAALLRAESEDDKQGNKKGIGEVRKQQNLLFDHECLVRSDMLDTAKEIDPLLHKCFEYGLMVEFANAPFVEAVEKTLAVVYDACDHNPFDLADSRGVIASVLAQRYYRFLENYPKEKFKRDLAIEVFSELQDMPVKSAKMRLNQAVMHAFKLLNPLDMVEICKKDLIDNQGFTEKQLAKLEEQANIDVHLEKQIKEWAETAYERMKRRDKSARGAGS